MSGRSAGAAADPQRSINYLKGARCQHECQGHGNPIIWAVMRPGPKVVSVSFAMEDLPVLRSLFRVAAAGLAASVLFGTAALSQAAAAPARVLHRSPKVLFFTKSAWFIHSVIKSEPGQMSHAQKILDQLGQRHGFQVVHSKDGGLFSPEGLAPFDAMVFYANGDLTQTGADGQPPLPDGGKALMLSWVKGGKGFVGLHAATDAFHSPGDRWKNNNGDVDPFIAMIGGEFIIHGNQQTARLFCTNPKFPGFEKCTGHQTLLEEWYALKNIAPDIHVLQWLATWDLKNGSGGDVAYRRGAFPITWARLYGKGRVFHSALGHREDVWDSAMFQDMVVGAIKWATGVAPGPAIKPNLAQVTPFYQDEATKEPPQESTKPAAK